MKTPLPPLVNLAEDLELAGLVWQPEIGDEISDRQLRQTVSILIDPMGLSPGELRSTFLWIPTVEQIISQFEARQAIVEHVGLEIAKIEKAARKSTIIAPSMGYRTVIRFRDSHIEAQHPSMRFALGFALRDLLLSDNDSAVN